MDSTVLEQEKSYELRPLVATDFGPVCKIITAIGIRQFKECFNVEDFKGGNLEQIGFGVVFDIAGIVIANLPRAEEEIQSFLASLSGKKISEIKKLGFAEYGEMIMDVVMKDEFQDFFKRVMKLFSR